MQLYKNFIAVSQIVLSFSVFRDWKRDILGIASYSARQNQVLQSANTKAKRQTYEKFLFKQLFMLDWHQHNKAAIEY